MKVLGVDPGTKSFDLALIENGKVVWEKSIPTESVATDPESFIKALVEKQDEIDYIAAPSGYGTPLVCNDDIKDPLLFATEVLLLSKKEKLFGPNASSDPGSHVYRALALAVKSLWERGLRACYIPAVIHLPTVPTHRKYNRVDMGTADKMAATFLGAVTSSVDNGWSPKDIDLIYVEMGYGYNAVIKVEKGKITDGHGGTIVSTGFLTVGGLDAEVAALAVKWTRDQNYVGGVSTACGTYDVDEAIRKAQKERLCMAAFQSMFSNIEKNVKALTEEGYKPKEILVSGRLARYEFIYSNVEKRLAGIARVSKARTLEGAKSTKEAAQGYAAVLEGIMGGIFQQYADVMRLREAQGTALSWVVHPALEGWKRRLWEAYKNSLTKDAFYRIMGENTGP